MCDEWMFNLFKWIQTRGCFSTVNVVDIRRRSSACMCGSLFYAAFSLSLTNKHSFPPMAGAGCSLFDVCLHFLVYRYSLSRQNDLLIYSVYYLCGYCSSCAELSSLARVTHGDRFLWDNHLFLSWWSRSLHLLSNCSSIWIVYIFRSTIRPAHWMHCDLFDELRWLCTTHFELNHFVHRIEIYREKSI